MLQLQYFLNQKRYTRLAKLTDGIENNETLISNIEKQHNPMKNDYQLDLVKVKSEAEEALERQLIQM